MALTRAQLLSGNNNNGITLPGQPQGVIAGAGIQISTTGIISVDSSSVTGLVKLNNPFAYNSYVWPGADGTAGEFLQTDGAGNLDWATPQGFAVVTVQPQPAPVPSDVGELWFDCSTGTLNVYQNCVGSPSPNWFNVAQPGFPVLPGSTTAVPPFTNQGTPGAGTQANPYDCAVTTVSSGSSTFIVNTVTVTGLAAFQYVPIVDLNAVTNLGRFSFSNYYANSSGVLTFQVIFKDLPASGSGVTYNAAIRVGYASAYIDAVVNVTLPLTLSGGSIAGTPTSGTAVAFTPPVASGGSSPYSYTYQWFADGLPITGATNAAFTPTTAEVGKTLSVTTTVTDSSSATASTTTTASSQTAGSPISNWAATGSMTTIPGGLSGVYTGAGTTVTVTGCIEAAVYTPPALPTYVTTPQAITSGQTLAIRWSTSVACGGAASGTPITGTVSDGIGTNTYNVTVNRIPTPAIGDITDTNVALNGTVSKGIATPISGLTTTAYVTYVGTSTGGTIGASLTPGGPFTPLATSGTGFQINNLQTLYIQQTAGSAINTSPGYTAIIRVGDGTNTAGTYDEFTYFAQTVATATFPGLVFSPAGGPNAAPASVSLLGPPALEGTATATGGWPAASPSPASLTVTGDIKISINGAAYVGAGGPYTISTGQSLSVIWDPAAIAGAIDGDVLTGSITNGTYTNSFTLTVDMDPDPFAADPFGNLDPVALSSTNVSGSVTPTGFNVPIPLSVLGSTATPMTTPEAAVGLGGFAATPQTVNPGEGIQLRGTAGGAVGTVYTEAISLGAPAQTTTWTTKTSPASPTVDQPNIATPTAGQTGVGTASGITITSSNYNASGGAGTHASSNWELYANGYPLTSTNTISGVTQNAATWSSSAITGMDSVSDIAYNGTVYVTVGNVSWGGSQGTAAYSTDRTTWTTSTGWPTVGNTTPYNVIWDGTQFVSTTYNGDVLTSTNGSAWTSVASLGSVNISRLSKIGSTYFIGTATAGAVTFYRIYKSTNLTTWTQVYISGPNGSILGFAEVGGTIVAAGTNQTNSLAIRSTDGGTTWTPQTFQGSQASCVVSDGTRFMSSTDTGVYTSPDAITWTLQNASITSRNAIAYSGGVWTTASFVFGQSVAYSQDNGATWTNTGGTAPFAAGPGFGRYINGVFYQCFWSGGGGGLGWVFPTGTTTLAITGCATDGFLVGDTVISGSGAAAGPATVLSLDNSQVTVTSSTGWVNTNTQTLKRDPASYSLASSATADTTNLVSWPVAKPPLAAFTTYYVRVQYTSNATVVTSAWSPWRKFTTGSLTQPPTTWTPVSVTLGAWTLAYAGGSTFIAFGQGAGGASTSPQYIITTNNGLTWSAVSSITSITNGNPMHVAYNGSGTVVASFGGSGSANFAVTTNAGATWAAVSSGGGANPVGLAYGNGVYMMCSTAAGFGILRTSTNGTTWVGQTTPGGGSYYPCACVWTGSKWLVASASADSAGATVKFFTSTDNGASWTDTGFSYSASTSSPFNNYGGPRAASNGSGTVLYYDLANSKYLRTDDSGTTFSTYNVKGAVQPVFAAGAWAGPSTHLVGGNAVPPYSTDNAATWTDSTGYTQTASTSYGITYGNGVWLAGSGNNNNIYYSLS